MTAAADLIREMHGAATPVFIQRYLVDIAARRWPRSQLEVAAVLSRLVKNTLLADSAGHDRYRYPEFDGRRWFWHTDEQWREDTGLNRNQVQRVLTELVKAGWVERRMEPLATAGNNRRLSHYRVNLELLAEQVRLNSQPASQAEQSASDEQVRLDSQPDSGWIVSPTAASTSLFSRESLAGSTSEDATRSDGRDPQPKKGRALTAAQVEAWQPSEALWASSREKNPALTPGDLEQWRDHHLERGTKIVDPAASWRKWVTNSLKYGAVNGSRQRQSNVEVAIAGYLVDLELEEAAARSGSLFELGTGEG